MNDKNSANYDGFSLVSGGLIYALTSVFRGNTGSSKGLIKTAFAISLITWVPLCVLALFEGTLNDTDSTISFFEDFQMHVRFLLVAPFLILIENLVDSTFVGYIKKSDQLIPDERQPAFNRLVRRLDNLTDSYLPEIIALIVIYTIIILNWDHLWVFDSGRNYLAYPGTTTLNAAGWFYLLFCVPIFQLLVFRWLWRWFVWLYSLIKISRFKLHIDPLHADQMAGLEYINLVPITFSFILVAPSAMLSAYIGIDIIYHGANLSQFVFQIATYVFFLPIILYAPLLIFIPKLIHAKSYGIQNFGSLIRKHNTEYVSKWIEGDPPKDDKLLGTMDNSSLADINGSYGSVQSMKLAPINYRMIFLSFVLNVIPYIPLIFTYYTGTFLFKHLLNYLVGS